MSTAHLSHFLTSFTFFCRCLFLAAAISVLSMTVAACTDDIDDDGDGYTELEGDCNDHDPSVYPDAAEVCNGIDDDCDGDIDKKIATYLEFEEADETNIEYYGNGSVFTVSSDAASISYAVWSV